MEMKEENAEFENFKDVKIEKKISQENRINFFNFSMVRK